MLSALLIAAKLPARARASATKMPNEAPRTVFSEWTMAHGMNGREAGRMPVV
jgi:hypothetical protein